MAGHQIFMANLHSVAKRTLIFISSFKQIIIALIHSLLVFFFLFYLALNGTPLVAVFRLFFHLFLFFTSVFFPSLWMELVFDSIELMFFYSFLPSAHFFFLLQMKRYIPLIQGQKEKVSSLCVFVYVTILDCWTHWFGLDISMDKTIKNYRW